MRIRTLVRTSASVLQVFLEHGGLGKRADVKSEDQVSGLTQLERISGLNQIGVRSVETNLNLRLAETTEEVEVEVKAMKESILI